MLSSLMSMTSLIMDVHPKTVSTTEGHGIIGMDIIHTTITDDPTIGTVGTTITVPKSIIIAVIIARIIARIIAHTKGIMDMERSTIVDMANDTVDMANDTVDMANDTVAADAVVACGDRIDPAEA